MPVNNRIHAKLCCILHAICYFFLHTVPVAVITALIDIHRKTDRICAPVIAQRLIGCLVIVLPKPLQSMCTHTMNLEWLSILIYP